MLQVLVYSYIMRHTHTNTHTHSHTHVYSKWLLAYLNFKLSFYNAVAVARHLSPVTGAAHAAAPALSLTRHPQVPGERVKERRSGRARGREAISCVLGACRSAENSVKVAQLNRNSQVPEPEDASTSASTFACAPSSCCWCCTETQAL